MCSTRLLAHQWLDQKEEEVVTSPQTAQKAVLWQTGGVAVKLQGDALKQIPLGPHSKL